MKRKQLDAIIRMEIQKDDFCNMAIINSAIDEFVADTISEVQRDAFQRGKDKEAEKPKPSCVLECAVCHPNKEKPNL